MTKLFEVKFSTYQSFAGKETKEINGKNIELYNGSVIATGDQVKELIDSCDVYSVIFVGLIYDDSKRQYDNKL